MKDDEFQDVPATLAVALTLWVAGVAAATQSGVFTRIAVEAYYALAAFASIFATAVVMVDARVRGWLDRRGPLAGRVALAGTAVLMVTAGVELSSAGVASLAQAPWAPLLLVGIPVTLASAVAATRAAWRAGFAAPKVALGMRGDRLDAVQ